MNLAGEGSVDSHEPDYKLSQRVITEAVKDLKIDPEYHKELVEKGFYDGDSELQHQIFQEEMKKFFDEIINKY
jgi:hypothetical protein